MTSASSPQNRRQVVLRPSLRRAVFAGLLSLFLLPKAWATPLPQARNALQIYFIDVEGGQATLFVTPGGQSLLIDTGWPGNDGRDADRIVAAARKAAINKIDFVLVTHFHQDHAGGLTQLAARIPIGRLIDHGDNREHTNPPTERAWQDYQRLLAKKNLKRMIAKPGDRSEERRVGKECRSGRWPYHAKRKGTLVDAREIVS